MTDSKMLAAATGLAAALACGPALAGTQTYTGSGSYRANDEIMPLNNGDAVVSATMVGVAAISTSPPRVMNVSCSGMGLMANAESYSIDYYCAFTEAEDKDEGFDVKGVSTPDGGRVEIVGGSGEWEGATGTGTVTRERTGEDDGSFTFVFEITTP